jgi:hypothetical protein
LSEQLQLRRNTSANIQTFTGQVGECVVDTSNNRICVNDFATAGGWPAAKLSEAMLRNRVAVSDAAYTVTAPAWGVNWVNEVAYTALTAPRMVTLPAAASYPTGTRLLILDEAGLCTPALTISVQPAGTDTINGVSSATPVVLNQKCAYVAVASNGSNAWVIVDSYFGQTGYRMALSPNGASVIVGITEIVASSLAGNTTVTLTGAIPANILVFGCGARVTTPITGATSWSLGSNIPNGGTATQFGSGLGLGIGAGTIGFIAPLGNYVSSNLILTAAGSAFAAGAVRLALYYMSFGAPTQ